MHAYVIRLDDALAIALDLETARSVALKEGETLDVAVQGDRVILRRAHDRTGPRYTLATLLADTTPADYRAASVDWGPDLGRETVD